MFKAKRLCDWPSRLENERKKQEESSKQQVLGLDPSVFF
jgi:hypothetical protein